MKKMVALTLALLMAASLFLSGCSVRKDTSDSENSGSSNGSGSGDRVVNVCSWGEYIDESLIDQFEEETGIKVNYQTAESNEVLYSQLSMGGVDYDVIVPSDYWGAVHGADPGEALKDEEGMEVAARLGRDMAWMVKVLAESRVPVPESTPRPMMNFIR